MVFYAAFNSISVISWRQLTLFMSFLGFISTRLGSEVSCPRTLPRKNPEDPVQTCKINVALKSKCFGKGKKILWGKEKIAGFQSFQELSLSGLCKIGIIIFYILDSKY